MDVNSVEISIPADSTVEQLVQEVTNEMHRNGMLLQFTEIPQQFDKITVRDFLSRGLSFVINETIEGKAQKNISPFPQKLGEKVEKEDKDDVVIFQTAQTDAQEEGSEDYGFTGTPEVWKPQHTIQSDSKAPKPPVLVAGSEKPKEVFTCHSCKIKKAIAFKCPVNKQHKFCERCLKRDCASQWCCLVCNNICKCSRCKSHSNTSNPEL